MLRVKKEAKTERKRIRGMGLEAEEGVQGMVEGTAVAS